MQYKQHEFHEVVSRFRANSQAARIPPPPSCSPPRFTPLPPNNKHHVLSEVELATFRTQLCESHQRNRCAHPDACPHSHCLTWQRRNPYEIIYDPHLCPGIEFRRTNSKMSLIRHCTRGRSCAYAHSKEEELYHPLMYKTKPCTVFPKCDRHYCPFAHSTEEVRQPFNNPLIHYIWGSPSGMECNDPNDAVHRWTLSPLASLTRPLLVTGTAAVPSLPREPLQEQPLHLHQSQLQLQQQQQQITQQRWTQDSQQTPQRQIWEQPHGVTTPGAPPAPLYTFAMQQQRKQQQQRMPYLVGAAKQTSTPEAAQQALSGYSNTKEEVVLPSAFDAVQRSRMPNQRHSRLRQTAGILHSLKVGGEEVARRDASERTGKGRRPADVEQPLLSQSLSAEKALPPPGTEDLEGAVRDGGRESQQHTLPGPSDTASSTTTTMSTYPQELLDSESIRRALIITLAQQLIGPQVNQLSVDQVLIVLDLAMKLAPHLQPAAPGASFFSPSPTGELLQLHQTESDTPQQSSSIVTNAVTQALSSAVPQEKVSGSGSNGNLQRGHMLQQPQQQSANEASAASASRDARSTTTCLARPTTTDDLLGDTTSSSLFDQHLQDTDPAASLAATQVLIEQLRKLSLLNVCEEPSHSCSSPAPSLEEAETSSLSIVRGSSTGVWSTSTSPIVGGSSDLSSRYANLSSRHVDLVPTTAITAAATTFASASSCADEASLCACPSLTITHDLNASSDKTRNLRTSKAAAADDSNVVENSAAAASTLPRKQRGKLCASPVDEMFHEHSARLPNRRGSSGGTADGVTAHIATKTAPSFSTVFGGEGLSPQLRGLLPPPGTNGTGFNVKEGHTDLASASYALPLADHDSSRCFSDCAATSVAAASSPPPPPPPPLQEQQGSFEQAQYSPVASAQKHQQDTSLQKRVPLTGNLTAARKLSEAFSPQVTTCSHSPSAGQFNSPQCFTGAGSSAEPTPAYSGRLPDSSTSSKHRFSYIKDNYQGGTKSSMHESKNAFPDGQFRQRIKADGPQASA